MKALCLLLPAPFVPSFAAAAKPKGSVSFTNADQATWHALAAATVGLTTETI